MSNKSNADSNQGDSGSSSGPITAPQVDQTRSRAGNTVFKSGTLFLSSRGIGGWITWKKRWFILTRTSLVFFRSDPSILPQKGSDVNLTLGGIDLNSSGSVVVKEDKKLLTVLFPDGRDGRAFTLKAETSEDLQDWKIALENALAQAPSAALVMGQNGIFRNDPSESVDEATEQWSDRRPAKSLVVGRPILLALQDIDGAPTFLEKALRFIEQHGVKVEGILRQSADVDDVNRRVQEYEEGKIEFSEDEDAHLIADCIKHVLRALPSSPVPAACCNALLEACRADRGGRVNAMRTVIADIFPEPNRHLLQRILKMMQIVVLHKTENRMSTSAVSACMAPLLLRPLLAGDCELDSNFSIGGDGSVQLLQAAAAANHAQAIVITLLDEYENIFGDYNLHEDPVSPGLYSGSDESGSEGEELTDEDEMLEDDEDSQHDLDADFEDEGSTSGTISDRSCTVDDQDENKLSENSGSEFGSFKGGENFESNRRKPRKTQISSSQHEMSNGDMQSQCTSSSKVHDIESHESMEDDRALTNLVHEENDQSLPTLNTKTKKKTNELVPVSKRSNAWGRTSAKKNLSMESLDFNEEEIEIQKLEVTKTDLQDKIASEVKENQVLHADLERRKKDLQERRLALEQDVARLQAQLRKERDLRATMETRLKKPLGRSTISPTIDDKTRADLEEVFQAEEEVVNLKKKAANLHWQLNQQNENNRGPVCASCGQPQQRGNYQERHQKDQEDVDVTVSVPLRDKSRNCEDALLRADDENRGKEQPVEEQPMDNGDSAGPSCLLVAAAPPSASSSSRRSSSKSEGTIPTASALSKLTTRLNFLKERRTQIVNELQNIENSRGLENPLLVAPPRTNPR